MSLKAKYEALKTEYKATRNTMSQADCEAMRLTINKMHKDIQINDATETLLSGGSIEIGTFLMLVKHYNVTITNSFNEWVQQDVVTISKTGYESYKIGKVKVKQLHEVKEQLIAAIEAAIEETDEEQEDMSSLTHTLDQNEMNAQAKVIRREGTITDRSDIEDERGCVTSLWIEHRGRNWWIMMVNGEVCYLKQNGI